jgi:hypothetical protein
MPWNQQFFARKSLGSFIFLTKALSIIKECSFGQVRGYFPPAWIIKEARMRVIGSSAKRSKGAEMSNFSDVVLMTHVLFGMLCIVTSVWVFVDVLNASEANQARVRGLSIAVAVFMWLAYLIGGYWYVVFYSTDKALILKGPWPFAHEFFMEMKEHVVLMLLLLATYLPIASSSNLFVNKSSRNVVLWVAGLIALIGMAMDGSGAIIGMGAKIGLLAK